jgi:transcription elongation GreA/GreB family factor
MRTTREELLEAAQSLPVAEKKDFLDLTLCQGNERTISDTGLRAKLLRAGLAVAVQSPKGPQARTTPSIIRLLSESARLQPTPRRVKQTLPTLEDLKALIKRIDATEAHVAREMQISNEETINNLRAQLAEASLSHAEQIHAELGKAFQEKNIVLHLARLEALRRVGEDTEFPQRVFVGLVAA